MMRRNPKIKKILSTDSQKILVDKLNSNFLGLYSLGGGNLGKRGHTGPTGPIGLPGEAGATGETGIRGTRWFIGNTQPQGGEGDVIIDGDYWIDTDSQFSAINIFTSNGWTNTGYNLAVESEFNRIEGIENTSGATAANAVFYRKLHGNTTFNFSDTISDNQNPLNSMFSISVDGNKTEGYSLLEFSRGDLTDGNPSDYLKHPRINFLNSKNNNSSLTLLVPQDELNIRTLDTTGLVSQDILFNVAANLHIRSSLDFDLGTSVSSNGGILIDSPGTINIAISGSYKPAYKNIGYDTNSGNRIILNSRLDIDTRNFNSFGIKAISKLDRTQSGAGTLEVELEGGNFTKGATGYKPDNYALKISTKNSEIVTDRFYISSAGSIYSPKQSNGFTHIKTGTSNKYQNNDHWYLFSNIDFIKNDQYNKPRKVSFASDKNEIIINPIGLSNTSKLCVGLQLNTLLGIPYLANLINIGESLKIIIRSSNPNIKISKIGITSIGGFSNSTFANYYFPSSQLYEFQNGTTYIEFTLIKQIAGNGPGDLVYFKGNGESGVWTVQDY